MDPPAFSIGNDYNLIQKKGLSYEKKVFEHIRRLSGSDSDVLHGRWIYYIDRNGPAYCQPDVLVIPHSPDDPILVIEVKLSYKKEAQRKLRTLYGPLVEHLHPGRSVIRAQICSNIKLTDEEILHRMDQLFEPKPVYKCIHWR